MARGKKRGGYQQPSSPAAVSGPGALSARTDGGPTQPVRVPTGGRYGEATALREQQQAAPLPQASGPATGGGAGVSVNPRAMQDPFRTTERPGEPGTAGVPIGPGGSGGRMVGENPDMLIAAFHERLTRAGLTAAADRLLPLLRKV